VHLFINIKQWELYQNDNTCRNGLFQPWIAFRLWVRFLEFMFSFYTFCFIKKMHWLFFKGNAFGYSRDRSCVLLDPEGVCNQTCCSIQLLLFCCVCISYSFWIKFCISMNDCCLIYWTHILLKIWCVYLCLWVVWLIIILNIQH